MTDPYWIICIEEALENAGIEASSEKVEKMAQIVASSHDMHAEMTGELVASSNLTSSQEREIKRLKIELSRERDKIWCPECRGSGRLITQGPYHSSDSECWKCRGTGKLN